MLVRFFGYYRKNQVLARFSTFRTFRLYPTLSAILATRVANTRNTGNSNPKILAARTPEGPRRPYDRSPEGLTTVARRPYDRGPKAFIRPWPRKALQPWPTTIIAIRMTLGIPRAPPRAPPSRENRLNRPNLGSDFRWCWWFIPYSLPECFGRS